jgi:hypothetical protein
MPLTDTGSADKSEGCVSSVTVMLPSTAASGKVTANRACSTVHT